MVYAENKRAGYDYAFEEVLTAGMVLTGYQTAQIRRKHITIPASYVVWQKNHLELINVGFGKDNETVPLLLDERETKLVRGALTAKGKTVIALRIKPVRRWIKVDIAIAKGKKEYEKRDTIKKRDMDRLEKQGLL
jgi:SsrA-binding protein